MTGNALAVLIAGSFLTGLGISRLAITEWWFSSILICIGGVILGISVGVCLIGKSPIQ